jgi:membrane-bound ClpP family serine protease
MLRRVGACGLSLSLWLSLNATAATLTGIASKEGKTIISLKGELSEGDSDALKAIIKSANDAGRFVSGLRLNSAGGLVTEGASSSHLGQE